MCAVLGYEAEEHVVQTKDGYLLCLHRLCRKKGEPYASVGSHVRHRAPKKPVVYLHHGLLMNSEVWVCQLDEKLSLPFRLVQDGYDVWFGNNRGNKYSKKSLHHLSSRREFWNFSMVSTFVAREIDYLGRVCILRYSRLDRLYIAYNQGKEPELHRIQSRHRASIRSFVDLPAVERKSKFIHCPCTSHEP